MKFGQLIEHNMRNIFVEKSYTKYAGEIIPRPLSKISKLSISLDQFEGYQSIVKSSCTLLAFTLYKVILRNKKWSGTSFPTVFSA